MSEPGKIDHFIVLMLENRSLRQFAGRLVPDRS